MPVPKYSRVWRSRWLCIVSVLLGSCVSVEPPPPLDIRARDVLMDQVIPELSSYHEELVHLEKLAPSRSYKGTLVKDLRAYLYAQMANEKHDDDQYGFYLEECIRAGEGRLLQRAFDQWFELQAKQLTGPLDPSAFSTKIMKLVSSKQLDEPLQKQGLLNLAALQKRVTSLGLSKAAATPSEVPTLQPLVKGTAGTALERFIGELCRIEKPNMDYYLINAKLALKLYVKGAVALCRNEHEAARHTLQDGLAQLDGAQEKVPALRFATIKKLIQSHKATGDRAMVSKLYQELFRLPFAPEKAGLDWGISTDEAFLKLLDDRLWAARNRALTGDYDQASEHAQYVLETGKTYGERARLTIGQAETLRSLRAEAYQTLATRIEVERGSLDRAINYLVLGNDLKVKDSETAERFTWLLGLYHFMNGEYAGARRYWDDLLGKSKQDGVRARLYFWLARAYERLGDKDAMHFHLSLLSDEYPLSFYNVVAVKEAKLPGKDWAETFALLAPTSINLVDAKRFEITKLREHPTLSRLLLRAELGVAAQLSQEMLQLLVRDFSTAMQATRPQIEREVYATALVYLSRLQLAAGMYAQSFATTDMCNDLYEQFYKTWPDQLFVLYPRPYSDVITAETRSQGNLPSNIAFAIARQESSFNTSIVSGAGAIGLMQLIPPTALRFAPDMQETIDGMAARLKVPEINVRIGTAYLSFLTRHFVKANTNVVAVAAAYNAGEFAVDAWMARRKIDDPLLWIEAIPYGETQGYVKNVWRNQTIYDFLQRLGARVAWNFDNRNQEF